MPDLTVRMLRRLLDGCDPGAVVRLAVCPDFPFAHHVTGYVAGVDEGGQQIVFLADGGQQDYLPHPVAAALGWTGTPDTSTKNVLHLPVPG